MSTSLTPTTPSALWEAADLSETYRTSLSSVAVEFRRSENRPSSHSEAELYLYHDPCTDGTYAAWVISQRYPRAQLLPLSPQGGFDEKQLTGKRICLVDQCFNVNALKQAIEQCAHVDIVDHHESTIEIVDEVLSWLVQHRPDLIDKFTYSLHTNNQRSACQLMFEELYPTQRQPWSFQYVGDRDLGKNQLPQTRAITAFLYSAQMQSFDAITQLLKSVMSARDLDTQVVVPGQAICDAKYRLVADALVDVKEVRFVHPDYSSLRVVVVEYEHDDFTMLGPIADQLVAHESIPDVAVVRVWQESEQQWKLCFRRKPGSDVNLNTLARTLFKGGGHPGASGAYAREPRASDFVEFWSHA